jgi:hypothetical protein
LSVTAFRPGPSQPSPFVATYWPARLQVVRGGKNVSHGIFGGQSLEIFTRLARSGDVHHQVMRRQVGILTEFQAQVQDQTARVVQIHVRMEFHQVEAAGSRSLVAGNQRADFFRGIQARREGDAQIVQPDRSVHGHQHRIVRHVLKHHRAPGLERRQDLGRPGLIELKDHVGWGVPRQTTATEHEILARSGVRMNFEVGSVGWIHRGGLTERQCSEKDQEN